MQSFSFYYLFVVVILDFVERRVEDFCVGIFVSLSTV